MEIGYVVAEIGIRPQLSPRPVLNEKDASTSSSEHDSLHRCGVSDHLNLQVIHAEMDAPEQQRDHEPPADGQWGNDEESDGVVKQ